MEFLKLRIAAKVFHITRKDTRKNFSCLFNFEFRIPNFELLFNIAGEALLKVFLGNKELSDCEEGGDTDDAYDITYCIGVVDDNVSCDSEGKNLEGVCRSKVDKHAYELKANYDGEYVVQEVCGIVKVTLYGKDLEYLLEEHVSHCTESYNRNDDLYDLDYDM